MILTALELTYNQKVGILYAIPIALIIIAIIVYIVKGCKGLKKDSDTLQDWLKSNNFTMIDCQVKCNKINEKIYKALRGEYENQGVYGDDY